MNDFVTPTKPASGELVLHHHTFLEINSIYKLLFRGLLRFGMHMQCSVLIVAASMPKSRGNIL